MPSLSAEQIVERLQATFGDAIVQTRIDALDPSWKSPRVVSWTCAAICATPRN